MCGGRACINVFVSTSVSVPSACEFTIIVQPCLSAAAVTAFPRLLQSKALTTLTIRGHFAGDRDSDPVFSTASVEALGAALSVNSTLTALHLEGIGLWDDALDTSALLAALQSHPSLRSISFNGNVVPAAMAAAVGSALGALIADDAPALESLDLHNCLLGDAGLGPVVAALQRNTHLRVLAIDGNSISEPFARAHLLPTLQACTTVHSLGARSYESSSECLDKNKPGIGQELERLLSPRRPAEAAR